MFFCEMVNYQYIVHWCRLSKKHLKNHHSMSHTKISFKSDIVTLDVSRKLSLTFLFVRRESVFHNLQYTDEIVISVFGYIGASAPPFFFGVLFGIGQHRLLLLALLFANVLLVCHRMELERVSNWRLQSQHHAMETDMSIIEHNSIWNVHYVL